MINLGLGGAIRTLTRFPLPYRELKNEQRILFWFPFIGAVLGLFSLCVSFIPLDNRIRAALVIAVSAYLTRGFHLDGLCDFADGLGGGWTADRSLEIMKDSHTGAFALISLFCTLLVQYACLQSLVDIPLSLVYIPAVGRLMQVFAASFLPYAREGAGTAASLVRSAKPRHALLPVLQILIVLLILFLQDNELVLSYSISMALALLMTLLMMHISKKRLGGVTGDVLGAIEVLGETAAMIGFLLPLAQVGLGR